VNAVRLIYTGLGLALVGVAFVGYIVPGMPATVFLVVALFCFKKGSPKFEAWLLNHPWFGATLRDWELHRAIKPRTKAVAILTMWVCICVSAMFIPKVWLVGSIVGLGVVGTWYIASRKSADGLPLSAS
jgi:uncharacterized membrane protein YbaN (DUF454 family)